MNVLSTLLPYVLAYKYLAIYIITFFGAFALPLPSGSLVIAGAAFSAQGYMNFWLVLAAGIAGNMSGDSGGYWLVRLYGLKILTKLGLHRFFKQDKLDMARGQLDKHPVLAIYFSRFFTGIAPAVNVVAGITELPYRRFLLFECLGEITEVSFFAGIGYFFGSNWQYVTDFGGRAWILAVAGALATLVFWRLVLKKK